MGPSPGFSVKLPFRVSTHTPRTDKSGAEGSDSDFVERENQSVGYHQGDGKGGFTSPPDDYTSRRNEKDYLVKPYSSFSR